MARICFEDFTPGETATYGAWPVTREEIVEAAGSILERGILAR